MQRKKDGTGLKLIIASVLITIFLLLTVLLLGSYLNNNRQTDLNTRFDRMYQDLSGMQTISLLSEAYDDQMACLAFESKLKEFDTYIWKIGEDIDKYRSATEEFQKSEYYLKQKNTFNENEVYYFLVMKNMLRKCNMSKQIVLFFYQNSEDCKKCDDQSFILTDLKKIDDKYSKELAIFSFDTDLNISTINLLTKYYKTYNFPCLVINEKTYCGIQDRDYIVEKLCEQTNTTDICAIYHEKYMLSNNK
jgi:hypothetical protein